MCRLGIARKIPLRRPQAGGGREPYQPEDSDINQFGSRGNSIASSKDGVADVDDRRHSQSKQSLQFASSASVSQNWSKRLHRRPRNGCVTLEARVPDASSNARERSTNGRREWANGSGRGTTISSQALICMVLTLTIAWLALQLPLGTLAGKCIRFGMGEPDMAPCCG
jgi:hypothetical protein